MSESPTGLRAPCELLRNRVQLNIELIDARADAPYARINRMGVPGSDRHGTRG